MEYVVKAPLVQAKRADGSYVHVDEGGLLPDDIDEVQLQQLIDSEMVATSTAAEGAPTKGASKDEWVDFAVTQGADQAEADGLTKAELIARYGSQ